MILPNPTFPLFVLELETTQTINMTYQKPIPADQNFLHDPAADRSAHVNSHEDIQQSPRTCAENELIGGRRSHPSCEQRVREDLSPTRSPAKSGRTRTRTRLEPSEERNITRADLETNATARNSHRLGLSPADLQHLRCASLEPPITKASLSELGLPRIVGDARLRHDIIFEREVSFKANMFGEVGKQKRARDERYWKALEVELGLYTAHSPCGKSPNRPQSPWHLWSAILPRRLPRMFRAIQEILKTLVPPEEWPRVDERLDIDLLMQQIEKDVCDIVALSKWISALMLGSCSPLRDSLIESIVSTIQGGVESDHVGHILDSLKRLFHALEMMKLDVANHQIRYLRLLMVADFVSFEQKVFLRRIPKEPNLRKACSWFEAVEPNTDAESNQLSSPQLSTFLKGVVNIIASNQSHYPSTFEHDFDRLRLLQCDFQACLTQAACSQVFIRTLQQLGHHRLPSPETSSALQSRIATLIALSSRPEIYRHANAVALEIVRECHSMCGNRSFPLAACIEDTEKRLLESWKPGFPAFQELESILKADFAILLDDEVGIIKSLDPVEIMNYFNLPPSPTINIALSRPPRHQHLLHQELPWGRTEHLQNGLLSTAKRTAHIAVLHWRVWLPILYEQPWRREAEGQEQGGSRGLRTRSEAQVDENGQRTGSNSMREEDTAEVLGPLAC